ncbi:hypothetical protein C5E02_13965 [Rathayibacter rathayi]|uniref:Uncharacterized protein n=1 Tax=Rathayibacter rathayi TaxID=33887 RepID=A0ABD6W5E3_RATRA|nr:hypothetical protein C1O28_14265 [Rathayibacter rathayi]PPF09761.1 hypothetical protein C5C04_14375 [Rathayibacter rathayi]PPF41899.1 hypothetical protein C5C08_15600 [Rathayibacter rathayi]PPF75371.1 hypothetical protein C5C14_14160 [Rathayibacter rathayi]PPG08635.1 hypothetical protein C5C11_15705 [Rathayibacter rathayi]
MHAGERVGAGGHGAEGSVGGGGRRDGGEVGEREVGDGHAGCGAEGGGVGGRDDDVHSLGSGDVADRERAGHAQACELGGEGVGGRGRRSGRVGGVRRIRRRTRGRRGRRSGGPGRADQQRHTPRDTHLGRAEPRLRDVLDQDDQRGRREQGRARGERICGEHHRRRRSRRAGAGRLLIGVRAGGVRGTAAEQREHRESADHDAAAREARAGGEGTG